MRFGNVENPELIEFKLTADHPSNLRILKSSKEENKFEAYVGLGKWSKKDLKSFYPDEVIDEFPYYSSHFNSIELNSTFYQWFSEEQFENWKQITPSTFRFIPKVNQYITHLKRLKGVKNASEKFFNLISILGDRLETVLLQMHEKFNPDNYRFLKDFIEYCPPSIPLAIELRNSQWYEDNDITNTLHAVLGNYKIPLVILDTAGRRDLLHMQLTAPVAFIRFHAYNIPSDFIRLTDWVERIKEWKGAGLKKLYFFISADSEIRMVEASAHFTTQLNKEIHTNLPIPFLTHQKDNK